MRLNFLPPGRLLPPATGGVRQGFRGVCAALAERHSHAGECASCKEGWDGGDACNDTPIPTFPHNCRGRSQPTTPLPCFSIPPFNLQVNNLLGASGDGVSRHSPFADRHFAGLSAHFRAARRSDAGVCQRIQRSTIANVSESAFLERAIQS